MSSDHTAFKLNASYLADLDIAWQKVNQHPMFQGIPRLRVPPIGMSAFDLQEFTASIDTHGIYTCGGNVFWADPFYTGTPGVPINRRGVLTIRTRPCVDSRVLFLFVCGLSCAVDGVATVLHATLQVDYYMSYFFRTVTPGIAFPASVVIAVIGDLSPAIAGTFGNLKAIGPEEPRHALIFAIARDIDAGLPEADLLMWKNLIVSAIITFKKVATEDDIFWLSTNARESVGAQYEVVYFSAVPPHSQPPKPPPHTPPHILMS